MHKKKTQRWSKLFSAAGILAVLLGGLVSQSVRAVSSNPTPVCVGPSCTLTFDASGDYYVWNPPVGAKNISFDLMGAQGGRSGGQGGRVTGNLTNVPAVLYIYVGGAGSQGSGTAGGFNGGGTAGSGRGDEGSGGGATDLRLSAVTADRIVVAGGGGGSGGFVGGTGGAAGGLSGSAGTSGQGQGGSGATQSAGGSGGYPNGGSWGSSGDLAVGGTGGSSSVSGGGGGGGGYFGGGGGGADVDSCCSNAGGGGGGSSWANNTQTASVSHTGGYRAGAGVAIITYAMPPSASTFFPASTLTNGSSINYNLVFSEVVTGLTNADFVMTGSTAICASIVVSGSGSNYTIAVSGCEIGTLKLSLLANSVIGVLTGPALQKTAVDVVIERTAPSAVINAPTTPTSASTLIYTVVFSETIIGLAVSDFSVTGASCVIGTLTGSSANYTVQVNGCADGAAAELALASNSVSDLAGNLGPTNSPAVASILIDRTAPTATWQTPEQTSYENPSFSITFTEAVSGVSAGDFLMIGSASGCVISVTETTPGLAFTLATTNCSNGTVQVLMGASSFTDALGNTGPTIVSASAVTNKITRPAPSPTPTPTPTTSPAPAIALSPAPAEPSSPAPASGQTPAPIVPQVGESGGGSGGGSATELPSTAPINAPLLAETQQEVVALPLVKEKTIAATPIRKSFTLPRDEIRITGQEYVEPIRGDSVAGESGNSELETNTSEITVTNPTDYQPIKTSGSWSDSWFKSWPMLASIALGAISVGLASIGIVRAVGQIRNRRLVRKFA